MPYRGIFHYYVAYFFIGNRFGFSFSQQKEILCVFSGFNGREREFNRRQPDRHCEGFYL